MRLVQVLSACFLLLLASFAHAQERPSTILVLDASGSMWGQIDGINKITIAREVVAEILGTFPGDQNLGLVTYGHRQRGDCGDIETLVAPAPGTAAEITRLVIGLNPRGMTPMTDAVLAAAEALRYGEQAATVILVSDGIETCNPDPCAAARAMAENGIDFTAHVVGFDVRGEAEALMQMQCLADATGGRFLTADNAAELKTALETIVAPPADVDLTLRAVFDSESGALIDTPVHWEISGPELSTVIEENPATLPLPPAAYTITAYHLAGEADLARQITLIPDQSRQETFVFETPVPVATLTAPATAAAGSKVEIAWTGPDDRLDNIEIGQPGNHRYIEFAYTNRGNPAVLIMPAVPGPYEIRYRLRDAETIATHMIEITPIDWTLTAPETVAAGASFEVGWTGANAELDNVEIRNSAGALEDYSYTRNGNPLQLRAPAQPGSYELRYRFRDRETTATRPLTVTDVGASLTAPATAIAGQTIEIAYSGPDPQRDYIHIGLPGEAPSDYAALRFGNPATMHLPLYAGTYELRYMLDNERMIYSQTITLSEPDASLTAPDSAVAGSTIRVGFTGPNALRDYIDIARPGEARLDYAATRFGNPATLHLPFEAGTYDLRYMLGDQRMIASRPITLTEPRAEMTAPASAPAGSTIEIRFTGPNPERDYIHIARVGQDRLDYAATRFGNPVRLRLPAEAGRYELRYMMGDQVLLQTLPIEVTPAK